MISTIKNFLHTKTVLWLVTLAAVGSLLASLFIQFGLNKQPCNLCILQRIMVGVVGVVAFLLAIWASFIRPNMQKCGKIITNIILSIPACVGAGIAIQHIYIQSLPPDQVPACGSPIDFMIKTMPVTDVLQQVLMGSGECAKVDTFLWVPIPWWSLLFFGGTLVFIWGSWLWAGRKS